MKKRDKRKRVRIQISIDAKLYKELKIICIGLDITPSEYIEKVLQTQLNKIK